MFFNSFNDDWYRVFEEEDYPVEIQFRAKQVEEDVLAVAFIEL